MIFAYGEVEDYTVEIYGGNARIANSNKQELETLELESKFQVFPNPTKDILNLQLPNEMETANVKVYDLMGRLLLEQAVSDFSNVKLNVSTFPKGQFIVEVRGGNQVLREKFMVE